MGIGLVRVDLPRIVSLNRELPCPNRLQRLLEERQASNRRIVRSSDIPKTGEGLLQGIRRFLRQIDEERRKPAHKSDIAQTLPRRDPTRRNLLIFQRRTAKIIAKIGLKALESRHLAIVAEIYGHREDVDAVGMVNDMYQSCSNHSISK